MAAQLQTLTKTCPKCGESKNPSQFGRDRTRADGLQCWCGDCSRRASNQRRLARLAEDPDAERRRQRENVKRYRSTPEGRRRSREQGRRQRLAIKHLIANHHEEYERLLLLARRGELPDGS